MSYLDKFARNKNRKGKTEVLTARIPEDLYNDFRNRCKELGLSISEAVYLLVKQEMELSHRKPNTKANTNVYVSDDNNKQNVYINNDINKHDVYIKNDDESKATTKRTGIANTGKRFTTKQWTHNDKLPCPLCNQWVSAANFSRHAKQHGSNTLAIFTNEDNLKRVNEMIEELNKSVHGS